MTDASADAHTPARLNKVWNVSDFAKRYRIDRFEENRLLKLLGPTATERELLVNAGRRPL